MALVKSTMLPLGSIAPEFVLPDAVNGNKPASITGLAKGSKPLLLIFLANHCPYVKHIINDMVPMVNRYLDKGLAAAFISASDINAYPEDSPEKMAELSERLGSKIPYLFDESQQAAIAYHAMCTPDIYLFDSDLKLVYRGQFDDSRPGNGLPVTGKDLKAAIEAVLSGKEVDPNQKPSIGCSIKWKKGNEPDYFLNPG